MESIARSKISFRITRWTSSAILPGHRCDESSSPAAKNLDDSSDAPRVAADLHPKTRVTFVLLSLCLALVFAFFSNVSFAETGDQAWTHVLRGENEQAERIARKLLGRGQDPHRSAVCLAQALFELGRRTEIEDALLEYEERFPNSGVLSLGRGQVQLLERNFDLSRGFFEDARDICVENGDSLGVLVSTGQVGVAIRELGLRAESATVFESTIVLARRMSRPLDELQARYGIAIGRIEVGRNEEAQTELLRVVEVSRERNLFDWIGHAELLLGVLRIYELDIDQTIEYFASSAEAYRRGKNLSREAGALRRLGAVHGERGDYAKMIGYLRRARSAALEAGDIREASFCLEHLGTVNYRLGNLELGLEQWKDAIEEGRDVWPREWLSAPLGQLGSAMADQGDYDGALEYLDEALTVLSGLKHERTLIAFLIQTGRCQREKGDLRSAHESLDRAIKLAQNWQDVFSEGSALAELARCQFQSDDLDAADSTYARADSISGSADSYLHKLSIRLGQARVARARIQPQEALGRLEEAIAIVEDVRRRSSEVTSVQQSFFTRSAPIYDATIDLLFDLATEETRDSLSTKSFAVAQRAKARSLLDLLAETDVDVRVRAEPDFQRREQSTLRRIAELETAVPRGSDQNMTAAATRKEIQKLRDELTTLESELRTADPQYAEIQYPRPATLEQVQQDVLREDELLLQYHLGESSSFLWAVTRNSFRFLRLPPKARIEEGVRDLLPLLRDYNLLGSDASYLVEPAGNLYRTLLGPVGAELEKASAVVIVPDGILHYLPFEALFPDPGPSPTARSRDFSSLPYLIKEINVGYAPSVSVLAHLRNGNAAEPGNDRTLLVGDPVIDSGESGDVFFRSATGGPARPLPFIEQEFQALKTRFPDSTELLKENASVPALRQAVSLGRYRRVHFGTHGVLNEKSPGFSGLLMSPDSSAGEDGFLSLGEVFGLELSADQVVLSACFTGLGRRVTGEGLVGLTRGFLYAGARSVVSALWAVSGKATSRFMIEFYSDGGEGRIMDGVASLSRAKRAMIRLGRSKNGSDDAVDYSHPYFWAGFVLTGEGRQSQR